MPHSDKNIVIVPFTGNANADPMIVFTAANANNSMPITVYAYPDANGTLSFEGSAGQLFSITNDLSGTIFAINDISGIPLMSANANGEISFHQFGGNLKLLGNITSSVNTTSRFYDNIGDVRNVPVFQANAIYVLTAADVGETINANANVLIPNAVFSSGQTVSIFNRNVGTIYVVANSAVNVVLGGTVSYGTRSILQNGLATIYCLSANTFVVTGAGVS